jgi:hypothetical protein
MDASETVADGQFVVTCNPGDVAVSVVYFRVDENARYSSVDGSQLSYARRTSPDAIPAAEPVTVAGVPTGYANVGLETDLFNSVTLFPDGSISAFRRSVQMKVTCADTTP